MKSKLLFSITLRDVNYLLENDYLNEKGKEWAKSFKCMCEEPLEDEGEDLK